MLVLILKGNYYFCRDNQVLSLEAKLAKAQDDAKRDKSKLHNAAQRQIRHTELRRARNASMYFTSKYDAIKEKPNLIFNSLSHAHVQNALDVTYEIEKELRQNRSRFPIKPTNTFIPGEEKCVLSHAHSCILIMCINTYEYIHTHTRNQIGT